jgi:hypothetical protein
MAGKKEEFAVVVCGKSRKAILLANMSGLQVDKQSAVNAKNNVIQETTVAQKIKLMDAKLDKILSQK